MNMERDDQVYQRQGFGAGLGIKGRIGLLIVDFVNGFADPAVFGGGNIAAAIESTEKVLAEARKQRWPVAHSRIVYADNGSDGTIFSTKVPGMQTLKEDAPISAIVPQLTPLDGELVVRKTVPSAFFGTGLTPWLVQHAVETLLIAGATTSGCIRASVVDAMSYGFRPVVLLDCVGDRAIAPHEANLFDMGQKYADVRTFADFKREFDALASR
jgi:maleamate amidohydrolase